MGVGGGEQVADVVEQARVGGRIGAGGTANGTLVDINDLIQMLQTLHTSASAGAGSGMVQFA